ncbi:PREDICTED: 52 kDa repressor of the inhibitor of the protein kinase-like, partial [Cyphomyrmex costatus]|uniref:52 kDa repressor of the inhibitor of the protein kinase-like n=1 Tax=Cyphomyrmex costatus TaxID=456900 RepID=UPI00085231FF
SEIIMDIRKFFQTKRPAANKSELPSPKKPHGCDMKNDDNRSDRHKSPNQNIIVKEKETRDTFVAPCTSLKSEHVTSELSESDKLLHDIGNYIELNNILRLNDAEKYDLLTNPWNPDKTYNFKNDLGENQNRCFRLEWLYQYPWLAYSKKLKDLQLNDANNELIVKNRDKLRSIISSIVFCGTHDLALRGKQSDSGNFQDLLKFRIEAGDSVLEEHFKTCTVRTKYTSHRVQNELLNICGLVIRKNIIEKINNENTIAFSLLADETADISGIEQLSIGVRFVEKNNDSVSTRICEEFLGFVPLEKLNAEHIALEILSFCKRNDINMSKLVGLGFDGCSTMAGTEGGVQRLIRDKHNKALFFHCASHRLNLVVNDLNIVRGVQNTVGTIKDVIKFFRESTLRRNLICNIPMLCETRWSAKYKSIRVFSENFIEIKKVLDSLPTNAEVNRATRARAQQLSSATSETSFIVCMQIIAKYSAMLEPVTNALQGISVDMISVQKHVNILLDTFRRHRESDLDSTFDIIFKTATAVAQHFEVKFKIPRIV